jgi:hypothetical protein
MPAPCVLRGQREYWVRFFAIDLNIADPLDAAILLGLDTLHALAVAVRVFSCFDGHYGVASADFTALLSQHSAQFSTPAREFAKHEETVKVLAAECLMAWFVPVIGQLIISTEPPGERKCCCATACC